MKTILFIEKKFYEFLINKDQKETFFQSIELIEKENYRGTILKNDIKRFLKNLYFLNLRMLGKIDNIYINNDDYFCILKILLLKCNDQIVKSIFLDEFSYHSKVYITGFFNLFKPRTIEDVILLIRYFKETEKRFFPDENISQFWSIFYKNIVTHQNSWGFNRHQMGDIVVNMLMFMRVNNYKIIIIDVLSKGYFLIMKI